jgi:DHA1 family multidrug resistance protein-like MFS transporter
MQSNINWIRNLVFIWLSQFFAIMAFSFAMPFVPFYLQKDLGVTDDLQLKLFISLFGASAPAMFALFSPLWGAVADRYGRRLMMLRANIAAIFVIGGMGLVHNAWGLLFFRVMQGCLTGTMTASQTMIAVHTPTHRSGTAFGALSAAVFSGSLCGNMVGGFFAEWFGYRRAFYAGAMLMVVAVLVIAFGVRDQFEPPTRLVRCPRRRAKLGLLTVWPAAPLLALIGFVTVTKVMGQNFLPLLVQELNGKVEGSARITGLLGGVAGIAGFASGILMGRLADKVRPVAVACACAILAGVMMLPQAFAWSFIPLFAGRFLTVFFAGGLDPVLQIWLARSTASKRRGLMFGWASSAKACGWMLSPLLGGTIASVGNVRWVLGAGFLLYLLLIPAILFTFGSAARKEEASAA